MLYCSALSLNRITAISLKANLHGMILLHAIYAYAMPTTRIVPCKLNRKHPYDIHTQHKKCPRILKQVLKPYDSGSQNQNV